MSCPSQSSWLDYPNDIWWRVQSIKLLVMTVPLRIQKKTRHWTSIRVRCASWIASRFQIHFNIFVPFMLRSSVCNNQVFLKNVNSLRNQDAVLTQTTFTHKSVSGKKLQAKKNTCSDTELATLFSSKDTKLTAWLKLTLLLGSSDTSCSDHIISAEGYIRMQIWKHMRARARQVWKWKRDAFQYM
jgi:hypothetical protein